MKFIVNKHTLLKVHKFEFLFDRKLKFTDAYQIVAMSRGQKCEK